MTTARSAALLSTTVLAAALSLPSVPAHADPLTCQGKPVTVDGTTGTPGDDVMVVGLVPAGTATGGAGNDVICIRLTTAQEPLLYSVDAGPGDDTVVNESTNGATRLTTVLGAGSDTYTGSDTTGEIVVAGAVGWQREGDTSDVETDTVRTNGGADTVYSGSTTPGALNDDHVETGEGDDTVHWAGEQRGAPVELGAGTNGLSLYPGWQGAAVEVDATRGVATLDTRPVLRWTGGVSAYQLALDNLQTTFTGTDSPERLVVATTSVPSERPDLVRSISMNGGDDVVDTRSAAGGLLDGGLGTDQVSTSCGRAEIRLDGEFRCDGVPDAPYTGSMRGWEKLSVASYGTATITGTDRGEEITAHALDVRINGLGGADRLIVDHEGNSGPERGTSTVRGGRGPDLLVGNTGDDRLVGGQGDDRLEGAYGRDVLLGGTGRDLLLGGRKADRLVGGHGRDRAVGEGGTDRCTAEVRRSCERR